MIDYTSIMTQKLIISDIFAAQEKKSDIAEQLEDLTKNMQEVSEPSMRRLCVNGNNKHDGSILTISLIFVCRH